MYKVIGSVRSRAFRVLWMLEEIGADYTFVKAGPHSPEVMALNPSGKVPVMVAERQVLTDSMAIVQYLADRHQALTFPAGTVDRARQDGITHFLLDEFDATLWTASRHSFVLPEDRRVPQIKDSLRWEFERALVRLESRLGDGPFLMGEVMTVPDILATHCLGWAANAKFPQPEGAVADYATRMRARPAFERAQAL